MQFWSVSLFGRGATVLLGASRFGGQSGPGLVLLFAGGLMGSMATPWTLVIPAPALAMLILWITPTPIASVWSRGRRPPSPWASLPSVSTVLACGVSVLDVQQTVDRLPGPDEKLVADNLVVASGGPAANAAVTAAALGLGARLVTRIGDSPLGALISADLAAHGVDVVDRAGPLEQPAVSTVLITRGTGQRAVVSVNASQHRAPLPADGPDATDWAPALVAGVDAVLFDGHHLDLALPLAVAARAAGSPCCSTGARGSRASSGCSRWSTSR